MNSKINGGTFDEYDNYEIREYNDDDDGQLMWKGRRNETMQEKVFNNLSLYHFL